MNERSWQDILIKYEVETFNYRIYNSLNKKIKVIHSINVNEENLYDKLQVKSKQFANENWQKVDDEKFDDVNLPNISETLQNNTSTSLSSSSSADVTSSANN